MDYEMKNADASSGGPEMDLEWQVDSEWVSLSSQSGSGRKPGSQGRGKNDPPQNFSFIPTNQGGRFLIIGSQTMRLSSKSDDGHSYWVCSMPCCSARCILDPQEKHILRYSGEHNHDGDVSRTEIKAFINALKNAVKEKPQVKPKVIYDAEVERALSLKKSTGSDSPLNLPSFDAVRTAMYNTRNAVLSSPVKTSDPEDQVKSSPSKSTRSREARSGTRKKSTPTKASASGTSVDLEELEIVWSGEPHKDANLSDFEDWLEDDVNANISDGGVSRRNKDDGHVIMPLVLSLDQQELKSSEEDSGPSPKKYRAKYEGVPTQELDDDGEIWSTGADGISRRKYRKRPASSSVFTCPHCPYKSNRHFNVQRHERLAHSKKKPEFSCKECGTSYSLEYRLKLHIKAVHQGEGHHCHICNRTFETMTGLKSHVVTKHKHEDPAKTPRRPPPELTCPLCGRVFSTKAHLQRHTASHVMVQPYRCFMCNKAFMEESVWLNHQQTCREPFTIQCSLCSKVLATPQELLLHMDTAHGRAEYSCNCGKSFPWKKSLLTHQQKCSLHLAERSSSHNFLPMKVEINASA